MTEEEKLIEALVDYIQNDGVGKDWDKVKELAKPFLPSKPRVGQMHVGWEEELHIEINVPAIELTDAVRTRLGKTGGVDRDALVEKFRRSPAVCQGNEQTCADIAMSAIADAGVEI